MKENKASWTGSDETGGLGLPSFPFENRTCAGGSPPQSRRS
jgi:hypothetical protein